MRHLRGKTTYSNVVATLALFLCLSGATAFAAGKLGKNSVGTKQLKSNAVTTAKIKNGAVTGAKIKNGSITGSKIAVSTLGTVPSAANASNAVNAANATTAGSAGHAGSADEAAAVDGMHLAKIHFTANGDVSPTVVFSGAGLTLSAECKSNQLEFTATTSVEHAELFESGNYESTYGGNFNQNFGPGMVETVGKDIADGSQEEVQGQLVYSTPGGAVVTAQFSLNESTPAGAACAVRGTAEYS